MLWRGRPRLPRRHSCRRKARFIAPYRQASNISQSSVAAQIHCTRVRKPEAEVILHSFLYPFSIGFPRLGLTPLKRLPMLLIELFALP